MSTNDDLDGLYEDIAIAVPNEQPIKKGEGEEYETKPKEDQEERKESIQQEEASTPLQPPKEEVSTPLQPPAEEQRQQGNEEVKREDDGEEAKIPNPNVSQEELKQKFVYVGNLHWWTTSSDIEKLFSEFGTVRSVVFGESKSSGRSLGFAKIEFIEEDCAWRAVKALNGYNFPATGNALTVSFPRKPPPQQPQQQTQQLPTLNPQQFRGLNPLLAMNPLPTLAPPGRNFILQPPTGMMPPNFQQMLLQQQQQQFGKMNPNLVGNKPGGNEERTLGGGRNNERKRSRSKSRSRSSGSRSPSPDTNNNRRRR